MRPALCFRTWGARLLAVAMTFACSGGDNGGGTAPTPQLAIALTPSSVSATQGQSISVGVTVTGSNGFSGPASVGVNGAPPGVTTSTSSVQVSGNTTTTTLTIAVANTAAAGVYTLSVAASGTGAATVIRSLELTVTALPGGFTIAAGTPSVSLTQGSSTSAVISIVRTGGFAGAVGLSASGMPNGVTAAFSPPSATGASATLNITANSVATVGNVSLTIVGSSTSLPNQSVSLGVTVLPRPSGGSGNVIVDFSGCPDAAKPVWFAYQDGNSAWTRAVSSNGIFQFTLASGAGGYAYAVLTNPDSASVFVILQSASELTTSAITVCPVPRGNKTVSITVAGVGQDQRAAVSLGGSTASVSASSTVSLREVPNGTFDLVAWRMNAARGLNTPSDSRAVIIRDVNVADGASAGVVNFDADAPALTFWPTTTFTGANAGDTFTGGMYYLTGPRESCTASLLYGFVETQPRVPGASTYGFPASVQRPNDYYMIEAVATNGLASRIVRRSFHTAGDVTNLNFGGSVSSPSVTDLPASYRRLQVTGATPGEYSSTVEFSYSTLSGARSATMQASVAWLGGNAATLAFPDFSAVAGWNGSWMPGNGLAVLWKFGGTASSFIGRPCTDGAQFRASYVSGEK